MSDSFRFSDLLGDTPRQTRDDFTYSELLGSSDPLVGNIQSDSAFTALTAARRSLREAINAGDAQRVSSLDQTIEQNIRELMSKYDASRQTVLAATGGEMNPDRSELEGTGGFLSQLGTGIIDAVKSPFSLVSSVAGGVQTVGQGVSNAVTSMNDANEEALQERLEARGFSPDQAASFAQSVSRDQQRSPVDNAFALVAAPQQAYFQFLQNVSEEKMAAARAGAGPMEQVQTAFGAVPEAIGEVDVGYLFDPELPVFSPEQNVEFGEILRTNGLNQDWAVRTFGFAGDLMIDPLLAGLYTRGVGRLATSAGASDLGQKLDRAGRAVDYMLSPVGAADVASGAAKGVSRAARRATQARPDLRDLDVLEGVSEPVVESGTNRAAAAINGLLNSVVDPRTNVVGAESFSEVLSLPGGRNPLQPTQDVFTGGAGRPLSVARAESTARRASDYYGEQIATRLEDISEVFGRERVQDQVKRALVAVRNRMQAYRPLGNYPEEALNTMEALAEEVADNFSVLRNDEAMDNLINVAARRDREGALRPSVGEELDTLASNLPRASSSILRRNRERAVEVAKKYGIDGSKAAEDFDRVVQKLQEADSIIGYISSGYDMVKPAWFERIAGLGGDSTAAQELWEAGFRIANEDMASPQTREALEGIEELIPQNPRQAQEVLASYQRKRDRLLSARGANSEAARSAVLRDPGLLSLAEEGTTMQQDAAALVYYLRNNMSSGRLDMFDAFRGFANGHLRRTFAVNTRETGRFIRSVRAGKSVSNRLLSKTLADGALKDVAKPETVDVIRNYLDNVSPSDPYTQGFLVTQEQLIRALRENGVPPDEIQRSLGALVTAMRPGDKGLEDTARILQNIVDARQGVAGQAPPAGATGEAAFQARRDYTTEDLNVLRQNGLLSAEDMDALPPDALGLLGRITLRQTGVLEGARIARAQYPTERFIDDMATIAMDNNVAQVRKTAGNPDVPQDWRLLQGEAYGRLNNHYVHPFVKKEIDHALRGDPAERGNMLTRTASRVRSLIQGGWLSAPSTIAGNFSGGLYAAGIDGHNVLDVGRGYAENMAALIRAGGMENMEHYEDIADILSETGRVANDLFSEADPARLDALGGDAGLGGIMTAVGDTFLDLYRRSRDFIERPLGGKVPIGLDAFTASENLFKYTVYDQVLRSTGDADLAYAKARNVVFDYTSMGGVARAASDSGVLPFISFPVFMTERVFQGFLRNPQSIALASNLHDAVWNNTFMDPEVRDAVWANLEEYQRDEQAIPLAFNAETGKGTSLNLNELLPSRPRLVGGAAENLAQFGMYGPIGEVAYAFLSQSGDAPLSGRYGLRVFNPEDEALQRYQSAGSFLLNSYMPAVVRKLMAPPLASDEEDAWQGLIPDVVQYVTRNIHSPEQYAIEKYFSDVRRGQVSKNTFDEAVSFGLRAAQPFSLDPALNATMRGNTGAQFRRTQIEQNLMSEIDRVATNPDLSEEEKRALIQEAVQRITNLNLEQALELQIVGRGIQRLNELNSGSTPGSSQ